MYTKTIVTNTDDREEGMTAQEQLENEHRRRNSGFLLREIALVCIGHLVSHFVVVKVLEVEPSLAAW